jgi:hypothetical protein
MDILRRFLKYQSTKRRFRPIRLKINTVRVLFIALPSLDRLGCAAKKESPYETQNSLDPCLLTVVRNLELWPNSASETFRRLD